MLVIFKYTLCNLNVIYYFEIYSQIATTLVAKKLTQTII